MALLNCKSIVITSIICTLFSIMLRPRVALAGPPFITDDPEPLDHRHWEVYIASQNHHDRDGSSGTAPHFEVNYGALPEVQLHLIVPLTYNHPDRGLFNYGYGDTEIGIKYRFVKETDSRPQVGTFPLIEIPTGARNRGLGNGRIQSFFPLWFQKSWGPWTTYGGGGYWYNAGKGNRHWVFSGWLLQRDLSEKLTLGTEFFHSTADTVGGENSTGFNFGGTINFSENYHVLFSLGRGIQSVNLFNSYVAFLWTFGPK
jgi:hypothetical protein